MYTDDCVFFRYLTGAVLTIYIDDIIIFSLSKEEVMSIKKQIAAEFDIKDFGDTTLIHSL